MESFLVRTAGLGRRRALVLQRVFCRGLAVVKVGDKVPVAYIKDAPAPTIKADSEYPSWLFSLTERLPTKGAVLAKAEKGGLESLSDKELMRIKRLVTSETIKSSNLQSGSRE